MKNKRNKPMAADFFPPQYISPHWSDGDCSLCADNASKHKHCSWCGRTFPTQQGFVAHQRLSTCGEKIEKAISYFFETYLKEEDQP